MDQSRRNALQEAVAREEETLQRLEREQRMVEKRLAEFKALLDRLEPKSELEPAAAPTPAKDGCLVAETPMAAWASSQLPAADSPVKVDAWRAPYGTEWRGQIQPVAQSWVQTTPVPVAATGVPVNAAEKVRLFRELFRGRTDVYPKLWVSERSGKKGYAPACANEWKPGVCGKPQVKCGKCQSRELLPVTDRVIEAHLRGKHVVGVYPLLLDETCWFLAADFDKSSWRDDVGTFVEICREAGVPTAVERSRSGNGAHVWILALE